MQLLSVWKHFPVVNGRFNRREEDRLQKELTRQNDVQRYMDELVIMEAPPVSREFDPAMIGGWGKETRAVWSAEDPREPRLRAVR